MQTQIFWTNDYELFIRSKDNRPTDSPDRINKLKETRESILKYGFLPSFPLMVRNVKNGKYEVIDGQGRLSICKELGVSVAYVIDNNFDGHVDELQTGKPWNIKDYARSQAARGNRDYKHLLDWCERNDMSIMPAATLLMGGRGVTSATSLIKKGDFEIINVLIADRAVKIINALKDEFPQVKKRQFINALALCLSVDGFDDVRLIHAMKTHASRFRNCATSGDFVALIDDIYNYRLPSRLYIKTAVDEMKRSKAKKLQAAN